MDPTADGITLLRCLAPFLLALRVEVVRTVLTATGPPAFGLPQASGQLFSGDVTLPAGVTADLSAAFLRVVPADWLRRDAEEAAVNFDVVSGLVDVRRHGPAAGYEYLYLPDWPTDAPPPFPDELEAVIRGTLPAGGAGVLADWIDDRTGTLAGYTAALRFGHPCEPTWPTGGYANFRGVAASTNAVLWVVDGSADQFLLPGGDYFSLAGAAVIAPDGTRREWNYRLELTDAVRVGRLNWDAFPPEVRL
jgi:hypothetical protein